jgi:hypothetical protein
MKQVFIGFLVIIAVGASGLATNSYFNNMRNQFDAKVEADKRVDSTFKSVTAIKDHYCDSVKKIAWDSVAALSAKYVPKHKAVFVAKGPKEKVYTADEIRDLQQKLWAGKEQIVKNKEEDE